MDQPAEEFVIPVRLNAIESHANKANNCNSSNLSVGEITVVLPLTLTVAELWTNSNCHVSPKDSKEESLLRPLPPRLAGQLEA